MKFHISLILFSGLFSLFRHGTLIFNLLMVQVVQYLFEDLFLRPGFLDDLVKPYLQLIRLLFLFLHGSCPIACESDYD